MVTTTTARRVLTAIAEALPEEGENLVTRVDIHDGWGRTLNVRLHTMEPRLSGEARLVGRLRASVAEAVGSRRHHVEIVWSSPG